MRVFYSFVLTLALLFVSVGIKAQYLTANFDDATQTAISAGWDVTDNDPATMASSFVWTGSSSGYSGACAYSSMYGTDALKARMKSPSFTLPSLSNAMVSFMMKAGPDDATAGTLNIYISTDAGATYLSNVIASNVTPSTSWQEYSFAISGYSGPVKLVFEAVGSGTNAYRYLYIDNIVVQNAPTCQTPVGLTIGNKTISSADFSWDLDSRYGNVPGVYSVTLKNTQGTVVFYDSAVTTQSVSFTGLQDNTTYIASVVGNCSNTYHGYSDSVAVSFKTLPIAIDPPLVQNFDNLTSIPSNYRVMNASLNTSSSYAASGSKSIKLTTTASNLAYVAFPFINLVADNFEMEFKIRRASAQTATVKAINYKVGYLTDPDNFSDSFFPVIQDSVAGDVSWRTVRFNSAIYPDTTTPIMVAIMVDAAYSTSLYVDDVDIHVKPTCTRPENLMVSAIHENDVTLSWNTSNASNFNIRAISGSDTVFATATASPFTMGGLTQNTQYQFSVQGVCSASDLSEWSIAVSAKTHCSLAAAPTWSEDFNSLAANTAPECWTMGWISKPSGNNSTVPFTSSTTQKYGTSGKSMSLIKQAVGSVSYISSGAFPIDSAGKYELSIWVRRATARQMKYDEGIQLWVTNAPGDTAGGTMLGYIHREPSLTPVETASGWYQYEYEINIQGNKYITIVGISENGDIVYFDNVEVKIAPTCRKVNGVKLDMLTSSTAKISWTPGKNESQWMVDYQIAQGGTIVQDSAVVVASAEFTAANLLPATNYELNCTISAICAPGDTAEAVSFIKTFTTECVPMTLLPYTNDFENDAAGTAAAPPLCWNRINDATSTTNYYPYVYSSTQNAHSGSKVMFFQTTTGATTAEHQYSVLPSVDTSVYPVNSLRLKFWAKRSSATTYANAPLVIGVLPAAGDVANFVAVDTVLVSNTEHQQFVVSLENYTGNGSYVALRLDRQASTCYCYVDDVILEEIPSCPDLNGTVIISENTDTSVKITLADSTAYTRWSYAYGLKGTAVTEMTVVDTTGSFVVINGLASATNYDIYVRRVCAGNDYGTWSSKSSFTTTAVPARAPYYCGFEDATENAQWQFVRGASSNVFAIGSVSSAVHQGTKSIYLSYNNGSSNVYETEESSRNFAYRTVIFEEKGYMIEFYWRCNAGEGSTNFLDYGRVLLQPASESIEAGATGRTISSATGGNFSGNAIFLDPENAFCMSQNGTSWHFISKFVNMTGRSGAYNLVLVWNNDASDGEDSGPLAVDDISITELPCVAPTDLDYSNVTTNSASISVTQSNVNQWEVVVDSVAFAKESVPANPKFRTITTTGNIALTSLMPNTEYFYAARAICLSGDTSDWSDVSYFRTYCNAKPLPYSENFENESSATCWSMLRTTNPDAYIERSVAQKHTGSISLKSEKASIISPEFAVDSLARYMISGWAYSSTDSASINVGVMVDINDVSTYYGISDVMIPSSETWTEFNVYFYALRSDSLEDFRNAKHIVIACGDKTIYFDDINVDIAPACPKPYNVALSNVTANSFDISFTDPASASQWIVYANGTPHAITTNPATISNLSAATNYSVSIATVCSATEMSDPFDCGSVKTLCGPMTTPWICGFETAEGYTGSSRYAASAAVFDSQCWTVFNNRPSGATNPSAFVSTNPTARHSGTLGLNTGNNGTSGVNLCFVLPEMVDSANMLRVKFWYKNAGTSNASTNLMFGYFTDPIADSSFVSVLSMPKYTTWTEQEIFTNVESYHIPADARLGFMFERNSSGGIIYLDDIIVNTIHSCSDPSAATVSNVTYNSAEVTFADTCSSHSAWEYVIGPTGFNPNDAIPVAVSSTSFTISGLSDYTNYDLYIRAVCGAGDVSNFVKATSFRTLCIPYVITANTPFLDSFEDLPYNTVLDGCYITVPSGLMKGGNENTATFTQAHTGTRYLNATATQTAAPNGLATFYPFHLEAGKFYKASVWARYTGAGNTASIIFSKVASIDSVRVMVSANLPSCTAVKVGNVNTYEHCWQQLSTYITVAETGNYYVGLYANKSAGATGAIYSYFDDFIVEELTGCTPAIDLTVDSATQNTVYVHHADNDTTHTYEYMVKLNDEVVVPNALTTANPFSISGLPNSSALTLYVRQYCGSGETSEWNTVAFNTQCGAIDHYPYVQSFEGQFPPLCWGQLSYGSTTNAWAKSTSSIYAHSGSVAAYLPSKTAGAKTILYTGEFNLTSPNGYYVRLWAYRYNDGNVTKVDEALHVGFTHTPVTAATVGSIEEIGMVNRHINNAPPTQSSGISLYEFEVPAGEMGSTWFTFDFHNQGGGAFYIDDVTIEPIPSCRTPKSAPVVNSTAMTTADISVDMAGSTNAQVAWTTTSDQQTLVGSVVTSTGSAIATGLSASTQYCFKYRYICAAGDTSEWSSVTRATTTATDCFDPQNLRVIGYVNDHHAELTWGKAPDAVAYEYTLKRGNILVDSAINSNDTIVYDSLAENTAYTFRVRTICSTDTLGWQTINFTTTYQTFEIPFVCDFEDVAVNAGWHMNTLSSSGNNVFIVGSAAHKDGLRALYVSNDGTSYNYASSNTVSDAEILIEMPAGNYYISYDWNCLGEGSDGDYYDYGRVFLAPGNMTISGSSYEDFYESIPAGCISLDNNAPLCQANDWRHFGGMRSITTGGIYKFVALWANDLSAYQPPLGIDNISIEPVNCMPVVKASVASVNSNDAKVAVLRYNKAAVEYALTTEATADSLVWTVATADTISLTRLIPGETYIVYVRHSCSDEDKSRVVSATFTTPVNALNLPFVATFETNDSTVEHWTLTSGTAANYFTIGNAASSQGARSLYITNDGTTNTYSGNASYSYAYVPLQIPSDDSYAVSYRWRCYGESTWDYGRIFLAPLSILPEDNVSVSGLSATSLPAGSIALDNEAGKLNLSTEWVDAAEEVYIPAGTYNLLVAWRNNPSTYNQPPLAIDNIRIKPLTCPKINVANVTVDSVSYDMFRIKVAGNNAGAGIIYHVASDDTFSDTIASGTTMDSVITVTGVAASTWYNVRLWSYCSAGDTSSVVSSSVRTECGINSVFPYIENFESYMPSTSASTVLSNSCWTVGSTNTSFYYFITNNASYVHDGGQALYIFNGYNSGYSQTFAMPRVDQLAGKRISVWYKNNSSSSTDNALLEIGYLTNPTDINSFTVASVAPFSATYAEHIYYYPATTPANARPAFRANGAHNLYVDDIRINNVDDGTHYYDTICFGGAYNAHGFSCTAGSLAPGDTVMSSLALSSALGVSDSIVTAHVHVHPQIVVNYFDTICAWQPYNRGQWNIANPTTDVYFNTFTSVSGCDSTVNLSLYVVPTTESLYDTICQGDSILFGGQYRSQTGEYVHITVNQFSCNDTITLHLTVADTAYHHTDQTCEGTPYVWEGQSYTQSGTYTKVVTGLAGCPLTKYLHLTVIPTDSICNVSFCQGGSVHISDTIITTAGQYSVVRYNSLTGCYVTYHVTATVTDAPTSYLADAACEGKPYTGYGIVAEILTGDTVVTQYSRTLDGECDSVTIVSITLSPTIYGDPENVTIPKDSAYTWHDRSYNTTGIYHDTIPSEVTGCDSICTLNLTVSGGTAVDNVQVLEVTLVPNPVNAGQTSFIYGNFTSVKNVEVLNSFGQVIDTFVPAGYPIEIEGINASGIYYVRVTTEDDKVAVQKLIVK